MLNAAAFFAVKVQETFRASANVSSFRPSSSLSAQKLQISEFKLSFFLCHHLVNSILEGDNLESVESNVRVNVLMFKIA
uniref:Ovule protein n=1 Tax=Syphacia muris TaxID=451379 RepID=A0A0N5AFE2_9BILA